MKNEKEEKGEFKDFTNKEGGEGYKNKVVFLRKSVSGNHLYAFDNNAAFAEAIEGSILMNISDVQSLIEGKFESIKISIMPKKEGSTNGSKSR